MNTFRPPKEAESFPMRIDSFGTLNIKLEKMAVEKTNRASHIDAKNCTKAEKLILAEAGAVKKAALIAWYLANGKKPAASNMPLLKGERRLVQKALKVENVENYEDYLIKM